MYDYGKIDRKVDKIIKIATTYIKTYDKDFIKDEIYKSYLYARKAHEGQFRLSGQPYINHPVEATIILMTLKPDIFTIQACLLHDVIEDTEKNQEDIKNDFGNIVSFLCEGVSKLSSVRYKGEERTIGSLRKMFIAMADDLRVVFIKIADRCHNMKTLHFHPKKETKERIALETLNVFAPIADRLGLYNLKNILEEECFRNLNPIDYKLIKKELRELKDSMDHFSINVEGVIKKLLDEGGIINYKIDYRIKSVFSIYKKMKKKNLDSIKSLYDLFGIRIIVDDETTCYKVLGLIHKHWSPLPNRFKDYIALPKPNGYMSLHTTVIGLLNSYRKQPTEIQIKTYKMKEFSDIGVAAHFEYKEKGSKIAKDIDWVKELKDMTESLENNDFIDSLKIDIFKDRIFVFTPKGDLINLPAASTPIDFAYYLHSDLGDHISVAKINGVVKTLDKELKNGDIIDITINKNNKPNPFWLSFVKTSKAKSRIKASLKKENKELYRDRGRDILNKYLSKAGMLELDKDLSILKILDSRTYNMEERWHILEQIGNFSTTPASLFKRILKTLKIESENTKKSNIENEKNINKETKCRKNLIIGGEDNIEYKLANCCKRKIPEKIVAHINKNGIIHIHKRDCEILNKVNKDRLLSAYIAGDENENLQVDIEIIVNNKKGILKKLSSIIYIMDINIEEINFKKRDSKTGIIILTLEIPDYDYLIIDRLIERIKNNLGDNLNSYEVKHFKNLK